MYKEGFWLYKKILVNILFFVLNTRLVYCIKLCINSLFSVHLFRALAILGFSENSV